MSANALGVEISFVDEEIDYEGNYYDGENDEVISIPQRIIIHGEWRVESLAADFGLNQRWRTSWRKHVRYTTGRLCWPSSVFERRLNVQ